MLYDNYAMLTKRELLIRLVTLLKENNLVDGVRYIPVEMRPRDKKNSCCVHKDRYIIRHKRISTSCRSPIMPRNHWTTRT